MIPFGFEYYRPDTLKEAAEVYSQLDSAGMKPVWYGGGTELISMARTGNGTFGTAIDIKHIPECLVREHDGAYLTFGAALTLTDIAASNSYPLLGKTAGRIADHTMQNKITLGGNISSSIIYRESVLPLLLADAVVTAAGKDGLKKYSIHSAFDEKLVLPKGEFLVQIAVPQYSALAPYFHQKKTKNEKLDYPLLTTAVLIADSRLRIAFSGLAPFPFRDKGAEEILNDKCLDIEARAGRFVNALSGVIRDDLNGSPGYRKFVLKETIISILHAVREERLPCLC